MILNSPYISGSLTVTGNTTLIGTLTVTGSLAGTATSASFAYTASSAVSAYTAASAVNATTALTASYATSFTVGGTLTAQTLVVQTITSSVSFITGSTRFGSLLTNTHEFTGSLRVTGSTISLSNSKVIIGDDGTYGGNISTVGFGGTSNGFNRIAAANNTSDGLYLIAATGRGIYLRTGGKSTQDLSVFPNGNTALGVNFLLPTATLHISGSGSGSLMQISSTVSSNIFFVSGSGNIGIGTTTPTEKFDVIGGAVAAGNGTIRTGITYSTLGLIGTFTNHDLGVITNGTTRMFISASGNVGIGTTTPTEKLSVVSADNSTNSFISFAAANLTQQLEVWYGGIRMGGTAASADLNLASKGSSGNMLFSTNSTERMRITSGGNVGINVTPSTGNRFWISGSSASSSDSSLIVQNSAASWLLFIRNDGNTGIGTNSPGSKLHLYDGTNPLSLKIQRTTVPVYFSDVQTAGTTAGAVWSHNIENTSNGSVSWSAVQNTSYAASAILLNSDTSNSYITFHTAASINTTPTERMRITGGGDVLVGTTSSPSAYGKLIIRGTNQGLTIQDAATNGYRSIYSQSGNLYFYNGTNEGYLSTAGTWVDASDATLKKDIKDIEYGLNKVLELKPKWYKMIDNNLEQIGFIAQDVEEVLPELVSTSERGMKGLSYGQLTAVLVKAIQELSTKLEEATTRIKTLESK